jgi:MYXO-CTERM domain-containing protein
MPKSRVFRNTSGNRDTTISRYYLELRTKRGLDNKTAIPGPRIFVHVVGDVPQPTQTATFDWVLDMDPATSGFDGMDVGDSFTDPAGGVSFSVQAMDNDRATIAVTIANGSGSPTCMDGSTFAAPGPTTCGTGGTGGMGGMGGAGGTGATGGAGGRSGGAGGMPGGGAGGIPGGGMPGAGTGGTAGGLVGGGAGIGGDPGTGGLGGVPGAGSGGVPVSGSAGVGVSGSAGSGISGTGGASAGSAGAPTVAGSAGVVTGPPPQGEIVDDGGCGCRTAAPVRGASAWWAAFSLVALGLLRRRRLRV